MGSNKDYLNAREQATPKSLISNCPLTFERASGSEIWDVEGNRYIDFACGIGVQNIGHCHPRVVEAVQAQANLLIHQCFQVGSHKPYIELARRFNELVPHSTPLKTAFFNSGAEAVENSLKIAIANNKRHAVLALQGGFHGRTYKAVSLTSKPMPYKMHIGPLPAPVFHAVFPDEYHGISVDSAIKSVKDIFKYELAASDFAALILEPVQGEAGFRAVPERFMHYLYETCQQHGIFFIDDEVQSSFGRTGKLFAIEHYGIEPDILLTAKSIANGLPLASVTAKAECFDQCYPGSIGTTYGGNVLACRAALAVLDVLETENCYERAYHIGAHLQEQLVIQRQLATGRQIGDIRLLGGMLGFEIVKDQASREPDPDMAAHLVTTLQKLGLLVLRCGVYQNTIRLFPALTISDELLEEGCQLLCEGLRQQ